jgi:RNA polymerase primary sigma factor
MLRQLRITKQITNRENDSLDRYFNEINKLELITIDKEVDLARRIREGDAIALEKLTKANLRFVVSVAKQYQNKGLSLSDLINEGNLGLIKAAQRFDETRGFKFISYAVWWIRQCIFQALAEQSRIVRLPLNRVGAYQRINRTFVELEQKFQREPSAEEVADAISQKSDLVVDILLNSGTSIPLDAPFKGEESNSMLDVIFDKNAVMPDTGLLQDSLNVEIGRAIDSLPLREGKVIALFFGLRGQGAMTLEDIGASLHITRERARQIKESAVKTLRKYCRNKSLQTYL